MNPKSHLMDMPVDYATALEHPFIIAVQRKIAAQRNEQPARGSYGTAILR